MLEESMQVGLLVVRNGDDAESRTLVKQSYQN